MNSQQIEKQRMHDGLSLDVVSIFNTIQGEGPFAGTPAVFIRLAGCNLQCPLCDTNYTSGRRHKTIEQIYNNVVEVASPKTKLIVITGGEPFRQNISNLVHFLIMKGYEVQVETNGTLFCEDLPYHYSKFHVVCSPKTGSVNKKLLPHIGAFKYVLKYGSVSLEDGLPTRVLEHPSSSIFRPPEDYKGEIYVQPADDYEIDLNALNLQEAVNSSLKFGYKLCIQIHKLAGVE